jgi:hypothetical protein
MGVRIILSMKLLFSHTRNKSVLLLFQAFLPSFLLRFGFGAGRAAPPVGVRRRLHHDPLLKQAGKRAEQALGLGAAVDEVDEGAGSPAPAQPGMAQLPAAGIGDLEQRLARRLDL